LIIGVAISAVYAISATGLVVTYVTSGIFNFAHGAIGMFLAFVYWELRVNRGWPTPIALAVTLLVIAPALGALLEILVMRPLEGTSVATKLVVTLALLLAFQGAAIAIWGIELRTLPGLFGDRSYRLLGLNVTWDQTVTILAAVAVAFGFRALFRHTRLGVAMRAVVDNRELCAVKGLNPNVVTATSWAMGASLAGLAAILIAPGLNLEVNTLSLLVVSAYAAAVVGRLQNLPQTFAGALLLGVSQSFVVAYLPVDNAFVANLRPALPFVLLFVALLARREIRLPERVKTYTEPEPPSARMTWALGAIGVIAAIAISLPLTSYQLLIGSEGLVFAALTISLVLLTGLSGQISLMQLSFAGLGAVILAKLPAGVPWVISLGIAAMVTGVIGALIALPALRLRGLYLALLTLAFALLMDNLVFGNRRVLGGGTTLFVARPSFFGLHFQSERAMFILLAVVAVIYANIFLSIRRSRFGRMLAAMRDAPNACQTLGMNITAAKLKVFGMSALLAGAAGAFLGGLQARVGQNDFLWFRSLSVFLVATVFGITSVSGAFLGAVFFVVLPEVLSRGGDPTRVLWLQPLLIALLAVATARRPEGISGQIRRMLRPAIDKMPDGWAHEPQLMHEVSVAAQ
ncbi:MAG TPA: ABC transporter permease, partial [Actinomycetota bacterium]|nr:ABC transporter permease [Actinomycetota bacterium]